MNIKVQACGFVLLVILYLLYHQQHTLQTYSRRAFLRFYAVTVLCILMDILSIVAIESASHLPALFVTFVCKTYLITLVLTALCGVMYIGVDILLSNKAFRKTEHLILLITSVICLSIYLLPISIYCDPVTHIVYTYGSSALMTYLGAVGLILLNFALILKYRRQIRVRRRTGMLLWMLVWILSAIIQFLNPEILVVGFGSCLGVVIIYLQFENPEINLDRASGMYNQTAFYEFIHQIYYDRSAYTAFVFINDHRFSGDDSQQTMQDLAKKLLSTDGAYIFKTADDEIVMLTPASMWNHADTASIQKFALDTYLSASSGSNLKILFLEDCLLTPCQEDFFSLLRYCRRTKIKQTVQRFIPVDSSVAAHMYAENDLIQKIDDAISQNRIEVFFSPSIPQGRRLLPAPKHWCACTMPTEICCRYMILSALPKRAIAFIRSVRSYLKKYAMPSATNSLHNMGFITLKSISLLHSVPTKNLPSAISASWNVIRLILPISIWKSLNPQLWR